jgi:hypothetical protein
LTLTDPGKRSLVLGVNGFGNLSGVIGAQLFRAEYAARYLIPFYATLGFIAFALVGYIGYRKKWLVGALPLLQTRGQTTNDWVTGSTRLFTVSDCEFARLNMKEI